MKRFDTLCLVSFQCIIVVIILISIEFYIYQYWCSTKDVNVKVYYHMVSYLEIA